MVTLAKRRCDSYNGRAVHIYEQTMDLMNTRAMRELCQSFRQPRPPIFVHGVNRVPRTERSDTTDTARF